MALKIFADCQTGSVSIPGMICVKQLKNTDTNFKKVDFFLHPGGPFIYEAHVTFLPCEANQQSANTSLA